MRARGPSIAPPVHAEVGCAPRRSKNASGEDEAAPCADIKASTPFARAQRGLDQTGIATARCRHAFFTSRRVHDDDARRGAGSLSGNERLPPRGPAMLPGRIADAFETVTSARGASDANKITAQPGHAPPAQRPLKRPRRARVTLCPPSCRERRLLSFALEVNERATAFCGLDAFSAGQVELAMRAVIRSEFGALRFPRGIPRPRRRRRGEKNAKLSLQWLWIRRRCARISVRR